MSSLSRRLNLCKAAEIGAPSFTAVLNDWKRERIWAFFRDFSDNLNVSVVFTPDAKRVEAKFENLQISESKIIFPSTGIFRNAASVRCSPSSVFL